MSEHFDLEPAPYEDVYIPVGYFLFDQSISPFVAANAYAHDTGLHRISSEEKSSWSDDTTEWQRSSVTLNWSFGFSTDCVSMMLQSIPESLKHKLEGVCVAIEATTRSDGCIQNQNHHGQYPTAEYIRLKTENFMQWEKSIEDEENDRPAFLRLSVDEGLSFNAKLADIWSLDWTDRHTKKIGHGTAFPFHIVDYLCIIVHDIDSLFEEATIRYCRVMSPNAAPPSAQLVCMLTRRKFESSGALAQVHPHRHAHSSGHLVCTTAP
jgi:hypothetical protein